MMIDNGNHLLLSGNHAALSYLDAIGARHHADRTGERERSVRRSRDQRTLDPAAERRPAAVVDSPSRPPRAGHAARVDYLSLLNCCARRRAPRSATVMTCKGPLYDRLIGPFLLAALNTEPPEGSAALAAAVIRETLLAGGRNYRPLIARDGLSHRVRRAGVALHHRAAAARSRSDGSCARSRSTATASTALDFGEHTVRAR